MIFNNPERHNAVSFEMWQAASRILDDFARDDEVRVVVLTGAGGKAFVSGADISKFEDERSTRGGRRATTTPTTETALFAASTTSPSRPSPRSRAIASAAASAWRSPATCASARRARVRAAGGPARARLRLQRAAAADQYGRAVASPRTFSSRRASSAPTRRCRWASSAAWCRTASWKAYVKDYAGTIAANAPLTVSAIKQIRRGPEGRERARSCPRLRNWSTRCFASQDYIEGRTAFMEKRKPNFTGKSALSSRPERSSEPGPRAARISPAAGSRIFAGPRDRRARGQARIPG